MKNTCFTDVVSSLFLVPASVFEHIFKQMNVEKHEYRCKQCSSSSSEHTKKLFVALLYYLELETLILEYNSTIIGILSQRKKSSYLPSLHL